MTAVTAMPLIPGATPNWDDVPVSHEPSISASGLDMPLNSALRWQLTVPGLDVPLDVRLVRQIGSALVGSFHGALSRQRYTLPRFERLASLLPTGENLILFSDPYLELNPELELAWFAGGPGVDLSAYIAGIVSAVADAWDVDKVVLTGSSGGGFAALQVGFQVTNSVVVAYNPQTSVYHYLAGGTSFSAQRAFLRAVHPNLLAEMDDKALKERDWTEQFGTTLSPRKRYASVAPNHVIYVQNVEEFHYTDHYLPFVKDAVMGGNGQNLTLLEFNGGFVHTPPTPDIFAKALTMALEGDHASGWIGDKEPGDARWFHRPAHLLSDVFEQDPVPESKAPSAPVVNDGPAPTSWVELSPSAQIDATCTLIAPTSGARIVVGDNVKVFRNGEWLGPITVGDRVFINRDSYIRPNVTIGDDVSLGPFVKLISDTHEPGTRTRRTGSPIKHPIVIGEGTWIGANATVLGGVRVGRAVVVMAGSVVTRDVPDNSLVGGVPARVLKTLTPLTEPGHPAV
ncbi:acyltransferase [Kocuria rhizophila]|uniref:acyltransferase n=1 Tax=Kocuria rhizophila TaxID=72000 RepID=UPI001E2AF9B8|nr:DapH/DapD/GlmU-related protein [Kocuria rhizophila]